MSGNAIRAVAMANVLICGLAPSLADAGVPGGILSYDQAYAALLAAKLNTRIVSVLLEGCASVDGVSFPTIQAVAIVD